MGGSGARARVCMCGAARGGWESSAPLSRAHPHVGTPPGPPPSARRVRPGCPVPPFPAGGFPALTHGGLGGLRRAGADGRTMLPLERVSGCRGPEGAWCWSSWAGSPRPWASAGPAASFNAEFVLILTPLPAKKIKRKKERKTNSQLTAFWGQCHASRLPEVKFSTLICLTVRSWPSQLLIYSEYSCCLTSR